MVKQFRWIRSVILSYSVEINGLTIGTLYEFTQVSLVTSNIYITENILKFFPDYYNFS